MIFSGTCAEFVEIKLKKILKHRKITDPEFSDLEVYTAFKFWWVGVFENNSE